MNKAELIDKGTGGISKLTDKAHQKTLAFCLVVSMIINVTLGSMVWSLTKKVIITNETLNEKRVDLLESMVRREVGEQVRPIADKVDTIRQSADSTFNVVKERIK